MRVKTCQELKNYGGKWLIIPNGMKIGMHRASTLSWMMPAAGTLRKRGFSSTFIKWFRKCMIKRALQITLLFLSTKIRNLGRCTHTGPPAASLSWSEMLPQLRRVDFPGGIVDSNMPDSAGDMCSNHGPGIFHMHGATKPVCHNYWAHTLEPVSCNYWACVLLLKPMCLKLVPHNKRSHCYENRMYHNDE